LELSKGSRDISSPEHIIDPSNKEKRIEDNDDISKCLSSHFSRIGKDSTVNPDFRKYILSYVEEKHVSIGNDETYLPVVFNNESISVILKSLKSGKTPGVAHPDICEGWYVTHIWKMPHWLHHTKVMVLNATFHNI
jgi:hypothetical protein